MKIHLGCGNIYKEGYVNCDISTEVKADKVFDLNVFPYPFEDNSVEEIIINHTLEHFFEPIKLFKEFYRICKDKATVEIRVPYFTHESATSMLDHYHKFTWTSFDALDKNHICHWQSVGDFKTIKKKLIWREVLKLFELFNLCPRIYQELFSNIFPARELYVKLEVRK